MLIKNKSKSSKIKYRNIFYMLCYATKYLDKLEFSEADEEDVQGTHDLLAYILCKSFELLINNGYIKEYDIVEVITEYPDGEIDIQKSIELGVYAEGKLVCRQNRLVIDNMYNQYIKAAINLLLTLSNDLEKQINHNLIKKLKEYRNILNKVSYLDNAEHVEINIDEAKEHYKPVLTVASIIYREFLVLSNYNPDDENKRKSLFDIDDPNVLCFIFEEFGRSFYYKEYNYKAKGSRPTYTVSGEYRLNKLDLLLTSNKVGIHNIVDFKWYGDAETSKTSIERQLLDYSVSVKGNNRDGYKIFATGIMAVDKFNSHINNDQKYIYRNVNGVELKWVIRYVNVNDTFDAIKKQLIDIADEVFNV